MERRRFLLTALAGTLAVPPGATAQQAERVWRVGYLSLVSTNLDQHKPWIAAFRDGLRTLGYVDGRNLVLEQRYAAGQVARLPALTAELVRLGVDVLVAAPSGSAIVAKRITSTVPIVFLGEPDPVGTGLVASLARPGGNITGLADSHGDLLPKRLERLKQLLPSPSRVGVLWNPSNVSTAPQVKTLQAAAADLGLTIVPVGVAGPGREDLDRAFATIGRDRIDALLVIGDPTLGNQRRRIADLSIAHHLPTSGTHGAWADGGLLMSYGTDFIALFRHGADLVDKILKGAEPASIPVEPPTRFELVLNLKTARALGLTVPPSLLAQADRVIE